MRSAAFFIGLLVGLSSLPGAAQGLPKGIDSVHQVELGSGPATVIVLHGGPGFSHRYLRPEWDVLAQRYRVVYYDQRGCGLSQRRGPYNWQQHVADLHTLVARYRVDGPVVLAGSSWGSSLALLYAWSHPQQVAALVLSGTPPWPITESVGHPWPSEPTGLRHGSDSLPPEVRGRWEALEEARLGYEHAMKSWMLARQDSMEAGLLPQTTWDSVTSLRYSTNIDRRLASRLGEGCPAVRSGVYASFRRGPHLADLAAIQAPVLLVHGTRANSVGDGAAPLVRVLPNGVLVTLMGTGHDPWYERSEQFFAHVRRFMESAISSREQRPRWAQAEER